MRDLNDGTLRDGVPLKESRSQGGVLLLRRETKRRGGEKSGASPDTLEKIASSYLTCHVESFLREKRAVGLRQGYAIRRVASMRKTRQN